MKQYQERYLDNLTEITELMTLSEQLPENTDLFLRLRQERMVRIEELIKENTELLRKKLLPLIDDIISAPEDEINDLEEFAGRLLSGNKQVDLCLDYIVRNALLTYARKWEKRDMLIRELYHTGMALFYMQDSLLEADLSLYRWKVSMMFGEAASYIKMYDEIEDAETRGYIHRSMANLALSYSWAPEENAVKKMDVIRYSLKILNDPAYHAKTPSLPWDVFVYKSHQERMSGTSYLRYAKGNARPELVREILESSQYVWERLKEDSRRTGKRISFPWELRYETIQYHCGIRTLTYLLSWIETRYMERDVSSYTMEGIESNIYLPAIYARYLSEDDNMKYKKREILGYMYRMMVRYVRDMPGNQLDAKLVRNLMLAMNTFIEYPGGVTFKDFLKDLVVCRNPDIYVTLVMTANISQMLVKRALEQKPETLFGVLSCKDTAQLREKEEELLSFAYEGGMFYDIGLLSVSGLMRRPGRSWLEEEQRMYEAHVYAGRNILARCESTKIYENIAFGHHRNYDEKGGFPKEYSRADKPEQPVTDIISVAAFLVHSMEPAVLVEDRNLSLDQAVEQAEKKAGTVLSPAFVGLLPDLKEELREYLKDARIRAYEEAFRLLQGQK